MNMMKGRARHIPPQTDPSVGRHLFRYAACGICNLIGQREARNILLLKLILR